MGEFDRDRGHDTLLDLHGQTLFADEAGHWVKFVVRRTEVTAERPHSLSYSLTLHAPDGTRVVGFDTAHPVSDRGKPGEGLRRESDYRRRLRTVRPYEYADAVTLLEDFWPRRFLASKTSGLEDLWPRRFLASKISGLEDFWTEVDSVLKERGSLP